MFLIKILLRRLFGINISIIYAQFIDMSNRKCYNISTMKHKFDISEFVDCPTQQSIRNALVERVKDRRKELKWTQKTLSEKSGVSYASVRRFEEIGEISLSSLMDIAQAMDCLDDFNGLFKYKIVTNLKDYNV